MLSSARPTGQGACLGSVFGSCSAWTTAAFRDEDHADANRPVEESDVGGTILAQNMYPHRGPGFGPDGRTAWLGAPPLGGAPLDRSWALFRGARLLREPQPRYSSARSLASSSWASAGVECA